MAIRAGSKDKKVGVTVFHNIEIRAEPPCKVKEKGEETVS